MRIGETLRHIDCGDTLFSIPAMTFAAETLSKNHGLKGYGGLYGVRSPVSDILLGCRAKESDVPIRTTSKLERHQTNRKRPDRKSSMERRLSRK
ncbi:hypothetical protein J6590_077813 [Homalodisca vitripennis]|nr:hypothetical protein J6590_077813 [Homalodisca vitripennis]